MITGIFYNDITKEYQKGYNEGMEDAFNQLERTVKKLGKKYYVEFLCSLKDRDKRFTSFSSTLSTHKCDCEYCKIDNK